MNAWHTSNTLPSTFFHNHFRGRSPQPAFWVNPLPQYDIDAWFPFNPLDPEGLGWPLRKGDYVVMRGTLWQDLAHTHDMWNQPPNVKQDGSTEMHPIDGIVRVRQPNPNARLTTRKVCSRFAGRDGAADDVRSDNHSGFPPVQRERATAGKKVLQAIALLLMAGWFIAAFLPAPACQN